MTIKLPLRPLFYFLNPVCIHIELAVMVMSGRKKVEKSY